MNEEEILEEGQQNVPTEGVVEQADSAPVSAQERFMSNIKNKYQGREGDDLWDAVMKDYDEQHEYYKTNKASNEQLAERLRQDPYVAALMADLVAGKPLPVALQNMPEGYASISEGDEGWDAYQQAVADKKAQQERDDEAIRTYDANIAESDNAMKEFAQMTERNPEQMAEFFKQIANNIINPIMQGKISVDLLSTLDKAMGYDEDVKRSLEEGRIAGRNEKILERHRQLSQQTPDLPTLNAGGQLNQQPQVQESPFSQLARERGNLQYYQ